MDIKYDFKHDILMRGIKILDIGYITVIYFVFAFITCIIYDKILGNYDVENDKTKSLLSLWIETIILMWTIGVVIYIARNLIELIPFPLDGYKGFEHLKVKEIGEAFVYTQIILTSIIYVKGRLTTLYNRTYNYLFSNEPKIIK